MKDKLEYKILKYLSENDNGQYLDIENLIEDKELFKIKLRSLQSEKLILFPQPPDIAGVRVKTIFKAKIEFKGMEYLRKIEKDNSNITNNFNNSTIGQLNQESNFSESPISIKINDIPSKNPEKKSILNKLFSNPWVIGISLVLFTAVLNGKRVMRYINDILDNI